MKTFVRNSCLFLLTAGVATSIALAQTSPPATNTPTAASRMPASKRFSGKISNLNAQAKSFSLEGATKDEILVVSATRISKNKQPATFEDLAVGQQVSGVKRQNSSSNWVASNVLVGPPRVIPPEPAAKQ